MAEREAPGGSDFDLDNPVEVAADDAEVDTGPVAIIDPAAVALAPVPDLHGHWVGTEASVWDDPRFYDRVDTRSDPETGPFDAFNAGTWTFKPPPAPWYRSRAAAVALLAVGVAAVAIVVSLVLLLFSGSAGEESSTELSPDPSPTSTPPPAASSRSPLPPPPPPPPAAAPEEARQQAPAPRRRAESSPPKKPEIGVTRTRETRAPISASPQPRT